MSAFGAQLRRIKDRLIRAWHRSDEMSMRLDQAPGVGPVLATAVVATVADPKSFRSGRNFSAWIGTEAALEWRQAPTRAISANKVTAIYAACSRPVHSPSSAMRRSMAPGIGHGSQHCWRGGRRPLLSFAVAMRVLLTGKRQPGSAANLSGSQPQAVDDRHGIPEAIRYESSWRTSGSLSCEPSRPR